jgi:flagellar basal-body rod modification protein FlgD
MTPSVTSTPAANAASSTNSSSTASSATASANQNTFLQLLVAELENQDPTNPTDGTQFVTQLAEFQQLQTTMSMATDVTGIRSDADQLVAANLKSTATTQGTASSTQS